MSPPLSLVVDEAASVTEEGLFGEDTNVDSNIPAATHPGTGVHVGEALLRTVLPSLS